MSERQNWLVCFGTDRIKQYLFATNRLKEIRGASALLADLDEERKRKLADSYRENNLACSAGGGAAVLVSTRREAEELIAETEQRFQAATITASITGICLPYEENGPKFGERMAEAGELLRRAEAAKAKLTTLPIEPYMRLCDSCGQQAAATRASDRSGDWLCHSCDKKREYGSKKREGFFKDFVEWSGSEQWQEVKMTSDLDGIGAIASAPNYVGFVALDGNHMGHLLDKPETVKQYRQFPDGLHDLTRNQTFAALQRYGTPRNGVAPFEIVLIGGDDVLFITAADVAVEVTMAIAEGFESD